MILGHHTQPHRAVASASSFSAARVASRDSAISFTPASWRSALFKRGSSERFEPWLEGRLQH